MELEKFEEVYQVLEAQKEKEKCETGKISKDEFTKWLYWEYLPRKK